MGTNIGQGYGYEYPEPTQSFWSRLGEKSKGWLYGFSENVVRNTLLSSGLPYNASLVGYATHYLVDSVYHSLGIPETGMVGVYHPQADKANMLTFMSPMVSKEIFVKSFHNEFVNNNKFYVEFIREENKTSVGLTPDDLAIISHEKVKNIKELTMINGGKNENTGRSNPVIIDDNKKQQILLNYMVDSVQFPNYTSKKTTISRLGQDFTFVNNSQYEPNLTINFTYDMRGNLDRFLHYMSQYSKYYNNTRQNKFKIKITSYKPMHHSHHIEGDAFSKHGPVVYYNEFKINTKTFNNVQLDSMQNYSLDNKQQDFLNRAITFTFQGLQEEFYDNSGLSYTASGTVDDKFISSLAYDMYVNFYRWASTTYIKNN